MIDTTNTVNMIIEELLVNYLGKNNLNWEDFDPTQRTAIAREIAEQANQLVKGLEMEQSERPTMLKVRRVWHNIK